MAAFITDIIDSVTDDKKNNMCLVQHRRYEKSHSAVPKTERWVVIQRIDVRNWTLNGVDVSQVTSQRITVCFDISRNSLKGFKNFPRNLSKTDSADKFHHLKIFLF